MAQNGPKWPKMAQNGPKLPKTTQKCTSLVKTTTNGQKQPPLPKNLHFGPFWAIFDHIPTVGQAITMHILVFQSKQKLFLTPTGASNNIETREYILGKQQQTKSG